MPMPEFNDPPAPAPEPDSLLRNCRLLTVLLPQMFSGVLLALWPFAMYIIMWQPRSGGGALLVLAYPLPFLLSCPLAWILYAFRRRVLATVAASIPILYAILVVVLNHTQVCPISHPYCGPW